MLKLNFSKDQEIYVSSKYNNVFQKITIIIKYILVKKAGSIYLA